MKKTVIIVIMLMMNITLLTGCKDSKNKYNSNNLSPSFWGDIVMDKKHLQVGEDLNVKLYFYAIDYSFINLPTVFRRDGVLPDDLFAEMVITRGRFTKELVQTGGKKSCKPQYTFEYERTDRTLYRELENFKFQGYQQGGMTIISETMTIPSDWFAEEMGKIGWSIVVYGVWSDVIDRSKPYGYGPALYYKIKGDKISIYDSYYDF